MPGNSLGRAIRTRRLELGIGLRELAARISVTPAYLSDIEKGSRTPIDEKVGLLARELVADENEWLGMAARSRGSIELAMSAAPGHSARDEAALALHRRWDTMSEEEAERIMEILGRVHE